MKSFYHQSAASWLIDSASQKKRIRYQTLFCVVVSSLAVLAEFGFKSLHRNLQEALLRGDLVTARKYLKYHLRADPADFEAALNVAARDNDISGISTVLSYCKKIPLTIALRIAVEAKSPDAVRLLLDCGANATAIDNSGNSLLSLIMSPVDMGHLGGAKPADNEATFCRNSIITLLRQRGARFTLLEAVTYADTKFLETDLNRGDDPNGCSESSITPLALAYLQLKNHPYGEGLSSRREVLTILREHNAHCRYFEAVQFGIFNELKWHLEHGANPNARLDQAVPYVCICAGLGNIQAVRTLLDYGADANSATLTGRSLLMTARSTRNSDLERLLLARGARDN